MRSWEADDEVARLLDLAVRMTGSSLRDIVNEAIKAHAPQIIRRMLSEREAAEQELERFLDKYTPGEKSAPAPEPKPGASPPAPTPTYRKSRRKS